MDALQLPGAYATRLATQRRLLLVLADEIAATEFDVRLKDHPGYRRLLGVKGIGPVLTAVEAVQRNCEPAIKDVRERIIARRGKDARNTAKVAAGRVMLETVYYLLRDGESRRLTHHVAA